MNTPNNSAQAPVLVDPNAIVYPTPKSDGAVLPSSAATGVDLTAAANDLTNVDEDDLDKFSDINSQDDALTRERKEQQRQGLRKGVKNLASNLVSGAKSLIQTTSQAVVGMGSSSPRAAAEVDPSATPLESPLMG